MNIRRYLLLLLAASTLVSALFGCASKPVAKTDGRVALNVVPYPDMPGDQNAMLAMLEKDFEAKHPGIDLTFRQISVDEAYTREFLEGLMTLPLDAGGVHLAEVDTSFVGDLTQAGVIAEQDVHRDDWHEAIVRGVTVDGRQMGVPHWMCGYYLMTPYPEVAAARDMDELLAALAGTKGQPPYFAGDFTTEAFVTDYYLLTWAAVFQDTNVTPPLFAPAVPKAAAVYGNISRLCRKNGRNPCLDGTFFDPANAVKSVLSGQYAALLGFTETANKIAELGGDPEQFYVSALPFGETKHPFLLGDAWVKRKGLTPEVQQAIDAFYDYMLDYDTYRRIILPEGEHPLYVIPARMKVFDLPGIREDAYYQRIRATIEGAAPLPNEGTYDNKARLTKELMPYLDGDYPIYRRGSLQRREAVSK